MPLRLVVVLLLFIAALGCGDRRRTVFPSDGGSGIDVGSGRSELDGGISDTDSLGLDGRGSDSGPIDTGSPMDRSGVDIVAGDTGAADTSAGDTGAADTGATDAGASDTWSTDVTVDSGPPGGCISGASGTHAIRFRWEGSGSGSTAYVRYETNNLPDTSRWRVTANSRSIGYRPVFSDPFLGEGGLELSGTVFIDVELSTEGLGRVDQAILSIYGRSYNTTSSGSFSWQTFSGTGASPRGGVHNSAPYEWYAANATASLPAGDDSILLRIEAGPPSNALIISRVEVCFTAR